MKKVVKGLVFVNGILGTIALGLCLIFNIFTYGGNGVFTLILCLVPLLLSGLSITGKMAFTRKWAAISMVCWLIVGMKTSGGDKFQGLMVVAFFAMVCSFILLIFPEKDNKKLSKNEEDKIKLL